MANSADPDQLADLDLHCLQRQSISGFSRTRVKLFFHPKSTIISLISTRKHAVVTQKSFTEVCLSRIIFVSFAQTCEPNKHSNQPAHLCCLISLHCLHENFFASLAIQNVHSEDSDYCLC